MYREAGVIIYVQFLEGRPQKFRRAKNVQISARFLASFDFDSEYLRNGSTFRTLKTRAVLSPGNRGKPCKFRYVNSVRNFMWKLCYRKDDPAMRPIGGCPETFRDSLTTPTATIPKIFHGLLFRSTLWMFMQNLKSVSLPVPEIIGGTQKIWAAPGYAFSAKFLTGFYSEWPYKYIPQILSP